MNTNNRNIDITAKTEGFYMVKHDIHRIDKAIRLVGANGWAVYSIIQSYINHETNLSFPSLTHIQDMTGFGRKTVSDSIKLLEEHGLIEKVEQGSNLKQSSNRYKVNTRAKAPYTEDMGNVRRSKKATKPATPPIIASNTQIIEATPAVTSVTHQPLPTAQPTDTNTTPMPVLTPEYVYHLGIKHNVSVITQFKTYERYASFIKSQHAAGNADKMLVRHFKQVQLKLFS